ncbi:TetR/AcrR family transcriptional regulator [Streptomyces sp. PKU-EA00015]|uniref:TetR/AcrR family transcriptional regulator n=1 Tax=Streptomyces sp. PKU-EA00015 TaxID=2748326 RepID=UPI0015A414F4|nr:TetR/AcrR family transcriptional regulator [Streptomyces sp. PKU-EA00015]NWF25692.1 TetR/AcrR family transcriptional regulator [Streptomyces sp. PKU-EA00015]
MTTVRGARERARSEITAAIKEEARRQLAAEGAAKLSLRAVARELGMVSSALYRYFPSRDDLLTALIVDAYDAVGAAAETAAAARGPAPAGPDAPGPDTAAAAGHAPAAAAHTDASRPEATAATGALGGGDGVAAGAAGGNAGRRAPVVPGREFARWGDVCRGVRDWALTHPHEYALIYGSPVPGYTAPQDTIAPASRVGAVFISIVREAHRTEGLAVPTLGGGVRTEAERVAAAFAPDLPPSVVAALIAAWAQLFGLISFELFGQFERVVEDRDAFFAHAAARLAAEVGLRPGPAVGTP